MTLESAIKELQNGNKIGLHFLINLFENNVYNVSIGILQNQEDAEEITQDVFVQMYLKIGTFKSESQFSTWLYRITVNACLQHIRKVKAKKFLEFVSFNKSTENESIEFIHPGVLMEQKENAKTLFKAIKKLPMQQQVAFTLKNIEQLKQSEIASILQISEGAVESLLQRAKQNLRNKIGELLK